jgi:hypothetical protein
MRRFCRELGLGTLNGRTGVEHVTESTYDVETKRRVLKPSQYIPNRERVLLIRNCGRRHPG